jgi:hypothetical protein
MNEENNELNTEEYIVNDENYKPPVEFKERNLFYANDALKPPPPDASEIDKRKYQQIRKSVKRLRRLEKNLLFQVQMLDLKKQVKEESNDG